LNQDTGRRRFSIRALIATGGGLGYLPVAPGTFGTAGGLLFLLLFYPFREASWFHFGGLLGVLLVVGLAVGIPLGHWAERYFGRKDPGAVVFDEWLGFWLALVRLGREFPSFLELGVAFAAFRLFDVTKPPPTRRVEKLPGGWGIMLDDLVAGVYAALLVSVLREWLHWR
jgi:phosphatidylglycerophosphatase A